MSTGLIPLPNLTVLSPTSATVGMSSSQIVAANVSRKGLVLINCSANRISLAFGSSPAVLDAGITLYPTGVFEMDPHISTMGTVQAIASGVGSVLSIQEYR
jgi:hypothetical protein